MLITLRKQNITIQNRQAILRNRKLCYPATSEQSSTRYGLSSRVEETGRENPNQGHASKQESKQGQGLAFRAMSRRQGMSIQTRDMHASKQASKQSAHFFCCFPSRGMCGEPFKTADGWGAMFCGSFEMSCDLRCEAVP